jgi:hypothetical protein
LVVASLGTEHERRDRDVIAAPSRVPDVQRFKGTVVLDAQQFKRPSEVVQSMGDIVGIEFPVERSTVVCRRAIETRSVAEDSDKVCLLRESSRQIRAIGDDMPATSLGLVLPVAAPGA